VTWSKKLGIVRINGGQRNEESHTAILRLIVGIFYSSKFDHRFFYYSISLVTVLQSSIVNAFSLFQFWLFENYLSPTFKTIAAAMEQEYGFEVSTVGAKER
jgi:hypothetical protein